MNYLEHTIAVAYILATLGWLWLISDGVRVLHARIARVEALLLQPRGPVRAQDRPLCPSHNLHATLPDGEHCPGCGARVVRRES